MKLKLITCMVAIALSGSNTVMASHQKNHTSVVSNTEQIKLVPNKLLTINQNEVKVDAQLAQLNPGDIFAIDLGSAGKYNLAFEHKTDKVEGVQYLEAYLLGDNKQRLSLKNDNGVWTGAFVTKKMAMTIGQANGKSYIANVGKTYTPTETAMTEKMMKPLSVSRPDYQSYRFKEDSAKIVTHPMDIQVSQLNEMQLNTEQAITLPNGQQLSLIYDTKDTFKDGGTVWSGYSKEDGILHRTTLVYGDAGVFGHISTPKGDFDVESKDGKTWLTDVKASRLTPPTGGIDVIAGNAPVQATATTTTPKPVTASATTTTTTTTTTPAPAPAPTRIDVLYVYDQAFFNKYKSTVVGTQPESGPILKIKSYIAIANQAYIDSGISMTLNPVKILKLAPVSTLQKDAGVALNELTNGTDLAVSIDEAIMQQNGRTSAAPVTEWRNRLQADVVVGFTPYITAIHKNVCGLAQLNGAYGQGVDGVARAQNNAYAFVGEGSDSASGLRCLENTMPHEIGHLMGAHHDRQTVGSTNYAQAAFPYAFGYRNVNGGTIMSYAYPRFNVFSSPLVNKCGTKGEVCGVVNSEDNARVLNQTKGVVSEFRVGYLDPSLKFSGTLTYYGAPLSFGRSSANGNNCTDAGYTNGYFSCVIPVDAIGNWAFNQSNIAIPPFSSVTTVVNGVTTTVNTSYSLQPITGSTYVTYSHATQAMLNGMNFNVNFGLSKFVSTCTRVTVTGTTQTKDSCTSSSSWSLTPLTIKNQGGTVYTVNPGTVMPTTGTVTTGSTAIKK